LAAVVIEHAHAEAMRATPGDALPDPERPIARKRAPTKAAWSRVPQGRPKIITPGRQAPPHSTLEQNARLRTDVVAAMTCKRSQHVTRQANAT
ncbi:hypothetical protein VDR89_21445, partial [Xanthomonas campestris pv. campestris]|nr:hypothetical protein [Xanthomonas campestris pv. campestris]